MYKVDVHDVGVVVEENLFLWMACGMLCGEVEGVVWDEVCVDGFGCVWCVVGGVLFVGDGGRRVVDIGLCCGGEGFYD